MQLNQEILMIYESTFPSINIDQRLLNYQDKKKDLWVIIFKLFVFFKQLKFKD
jgi:hypothetical protein